METFNIQHSTLNVERSASNDEPSARRKPFQFDPVLAAALCASAANTYELHPPGEIIQCDSTEARVVCARWFGDVRANLSIHGPWDDSFSGEHTRPRVFPSAPSPMESLPPKDAVGGAPTAAHEGACAPRKNAEIRTGCADATRSTEHATGSSDSLAPRSGERARERGFSRSVDQRFGDPDDVHGTRNTEHAFLIVSFRGTANIRNWITDLDCLKTGYPTVDYGGCRVHLGFWRAWLSVRDQVWKWIESSLAENRRTDVYFTGHSLGGALAMLAAHGFHLEFGEIPTTYTFGQPRVGNRNFADGFDLVLRPFTFRVVHANDIVPRVPLLAGGYRHAGREAFCGFNAIEKSKRPNAEHSTFNAQRTNRTNGSSMLNVECSEFLIDPTPLDKLPFDIRNAWREIRRGKLALLDDHHVNTYLNLFQ